MVKNELLDISGVELVDDLYSRRDDRDAFMIRALCNQLRKHLIPKLKAKKGKMVTVENANAYQIPKQ